MKFTFSWLKEHLDTTASVSEIGDALTDLGLEVENILDPASHLESFTIGKIIKAEQHPNADRLRVCLVQTDEGEKQIICGADNARTGINVVVAKPGSYVPGIDTTIGVGNIRGVESEGMMCSEREMGMSDEHDGIIEIPSGQIGEKFVDWLKVKNPSKMDAVIEIAITPNRPDALGVRGIARDLAAKGIGVLKAQEKVTLPGKFESQVKVSIDKDTQKNGCEIFSGRLIRKVKNGPSPTWLQDRLIALGLRPISILVDITNFFTFDSNRPLHVFDADKLSGNLRVHKLTKPTEFIGLDEKKYYLSEGMVVISDDKEIVSIAGIMGGLNSGCTDTTQNVFLEAAIWNNVQIAKTGRVLKINSDARYRNERGIDPGFNNEAIELASKMIVDLCGGEPSIVVSAGKVESKARSYKLDLNRVNTLVGMDVPEGEQLRILDELGFEVNQGRAFPPTWRPDILGEADLVEEIVRVSSLQNLIGKPLARTNIGVPKPVLTLLQRRERTARRTLASIGYNECVSYSFIDRDSALQFCGGDDLIPLENPISIDMGYMRQDLLPNLLKAAQRNQARGFLDLSLFEVGTIFSGKEPGQQSIVATGLLIGNTSPRDPHGGRRAVDVFDAKADMEIILQALVAPKTTKIYRDTPKVWHPGRSGRISLGPKNTLAVFGEVHPKIVKSFGLKGSVLAFTVLIENIPTRKVNTATRDALTISDFQAVDRDFSFIIDDKVEASLVVGAAESIDKSLIESVTVFDEFSGVKASQQFGDGKKSLAISVRLQPRDKTFTDKEIDEISSKIVMAVIDKTGGELRS
jgi:phenylalanyl-tRNA synthetase beta chain